MPFMYFITLAFNTVNIQTIFFSKSSAIKT